MRAFTCFFDDTRYTVPTLTVYLTTDAARACQLANRDLEANPHYSGFELCDGQRRVYAESKLAKGGRSSGLPA